MLQAQSLLESLSESYLAVARQPGKARALVLALALDDEAEARGRQLAFIQHELGAAFHDEVKALLPEVDALSDVQRMPALLQVFGSMHQVARSIASIC